MQERSPAGARGVPKELVEFFRQVKDEEQKRAERAKQLLGRKIGQSGR